MTQKNTNPSAPAAAPKGTEAANGAIMSPADKLAALRAKAEQERAAAEATQRELDAAEAEVRQAEAAKAMEGIITILGAMTVAANAGEAQTVVDTHKGALTEAINGLTETLGLKKAKGTGRGAPGGRIRTGTDADTAKQWLERHYNGVRDTKDATDLQVGPTAWYTVSQVAQGIGYNGTDGPTGRDGQVRNALDKLCGAEATDHGPAAEKRDASQGVAAYRFRPAPAVPSVLAGVSTTEPKGEAGDTPTNTEGEGTPKE